MSCAKRAAMVLRSTWALAAVVGLTLAACAPAEMIPALTVGKTYGTDAHVRASKPDAILRYAMHPRGFAELRVPEGRGPFPLAVIFHGGCWKTGIADTAYMASLATRWQQLGIATLNVDYREVGDGGGWPGSFQDWAAAEELIDDLARDPRIDGARLAYVGHSAGALPAQWLAVAQDEHGPVGQREPKRRASAIVFDGPADLALDQAPFDALCQFSAVAPFMGGSVGELRERYMAISPLQNPARLRELLFVQAKLPAPDADALEALRKAGASVAAVLKPEATHFDVITPGALAYESVEAQVLEVLRR